MPPKFDPNANTFIPGQGQGQNWGNNAQPMGYQGYGGYQQQQYVPINTNYNNNYNHNNNNSYNNNRRGRFNNNRRGGGHGGFNNRNHNQAMSYEDFLKSQSASLNRKPQTHKSTSATPEPESSTSGASTPTLHSAQASSTSLASLNNNLKKLSLDATPISENLTRLRQATKLSEVRAEVDQITNLVFNSGISSLKEWKILDVLKTLSKPKNSSLIKESSMILLTSLAQKYAGQVPYEAHFVSFFGVAFDSLADKENTVKRAGQSAIDALYGMFPQEAKGGVVLLELLEYLKSGAKWQCKVGLSLFQF
ncbi:unnamed protein product [Ambrosiozyma monospora]|uniref:Unnamed protein product n=1 Tax=Ambrosiozyma monospora TaxID=43982 RepID=A0ACB5TUE5_AMBMO|nr:unnamed protein product [Ambrosiozyma monospora]